MSRLHIRTCHIPAPVFILEPPQSAPSAATLVLSCGRMSGARRPSAERPLVPAGCATSSTYPGGSRTASGMPFRVPRTQVSYSPTNLGKTLLLPRRPRRRRPRHELYTPLSLQRLSGPSPLCFISLPHPARACSLAPHARAKYMSYVPCDILCLSSLPRSCSNYRRWDWDRLRMR